MLIISHFIKNRFVVKCGGFVWIFYYKLVLYNKTDMGMFEDVEDIFEEDEELIEVDDLLMTISEKRWGDYWIEKLGRYNPRKAIKPKPTPPKREASKWEEVEGYPLLEWIEKNDKLTFRYGQKKIEPRYNSTEKRWMIYFKVGHGSKSEIYRLYLDEILPNITIKMKKR